jgi:hypothetical protein
MSSKKNKMQYAMLSVAFVAFIIAWAFYPFLNTRTILHPQASKGFIARAVDLNSIEVTDLQGTAPGVAINAAETGKLLKEEKAQSSLTRIIKDENYQALLDETSITESGGRYTPPAAGSEVKKGAKENPSDKGEKAEPGDKKSSKAASDKVGTGSGRSGTSASIRRHFFGNKAADVKLAKADSKIAKTNKKAGTVLEKLKLALGQSKLATKSSTLEGKKEAGTSAFENLTDKDLKVGMEEYEKSGTSKPVEIKDRLVSSVLGGEGPVQQGAVEFAPVPEPEELDKSEDKINAEIEDLERRLREDEDFRKSVTKDQLKSILLKLGIAVLLGPILGLIPAAGP